MLSKVIKKDSREQRLVTRQECVYAFEMSKDDQQESLFYYIRINKYRYLRELKCINSILNSRTDSRI